MALLNKYYKRYATLKPSIGKNRNYFFPNHKPIKKIHENSLPLASKVGKPLNFRPCSTRYSIQKKQSGVKGGFLYIFRPFISSAIFSLGHFFSIPSSSFNPNVTISFKPRLPVSTPFIDVENRIFNRGNVKNAL